MKMKMKKIMKKTIAMMLALAIALSTVACGGDDQEGVTKVNFMYSGNSIVTAIYKALIDEFNDTVGKEEGIVVKGIPKLTSMIQAATQQLSSNNGPDLVSFQDDELKLFGQYLEDMSEKISQDILGALYPGMLERGYFNEEKMTSREGDPLISLPIFNDPTYLYYNKTVLEELNVICISVPEEELAAFNEGTAKDGNGKTRADYGITIDVPAKGFYRSESPYVPEEGETDGSSWVMPSENEVLIFNNRIAMNWDEVEDLAMLCTDDYNTDSPTPYGYYTQWWFAYGWAVGGDCLEDLTGDGDWTFSLMGDTPNYIVGEGKSYTGLYTGTTYNAGETLNLKDVLVTEPGDTISYETDGKTYYTYTVNGKKADTRDFSAETADGTLTELPSIQDAFTRFCWLSGVGGLNVCPYPTVFNGTTDVAYFTSGKLAMIVERFTNYSVIERAMSDEFDIAPLPVYKEYTEPENPDCDTVLRQGKTVAHSRAYTLSISKKSKKKDAAYAFMNWIATDGQQWLARNGYMSSRAADKELSVENLNRKNASVIVDMHAVSRRGDWSYMPDTTWINIWANPLNYQVRYGKMTLEEFMYAYIEDTNEGLQVYRR